MITENDPVVSGLLAELERVETQLGSDEFAVQSALTTFKVSKRKYAAIRDATRELLGKSPYSPGVRWPSQRKSNFHSRYRYAMTKPGDAVVEALREADKPLGLDELVDLFKAGRLESADPRTINAAVMNTRGVHKNAEGRYYYSEGRIHRERGS